MSKWRVAFLNFKSRTKVYSNYHYTKNVFAVLHLEVSTYVLNISSQYINHFPNIMWRFHIFLDSVGFIHPLETLIFYIIKSFPATDKLFSAFFFQILYFYDIVYNFRKSSYSVFICITIESHLETKSCTVTH